MFARTHTMPQFTAVFVYTSLLALTPAVADQKAPGIKEIVSLLSASERLLENIYVEAAATLDESSDGKSWVQTPCMSAVKTWLNGSMDGPFRIDVDREVIAWNDAPAGKPPFTQKSYVVSYDGRRLINLQKSVGWLGDSRPVRTAEITSGTESARSSVAYCIASGATFSTNFRSSNDHKTLSEYLSNWIEQQKEHPELAPVNRTEIVDRDGVRVVKVVVGYDSKVEHTWWLDPARGWAIVGYELRRGADRTLVSQQIIHRLHNAADGIWYPADAELIKPAASGVKDRKHQKWRYRATEIIANDPRVESDIANLPISAGTQVTDKVQNRIYEVAAPDDKTSSAIDALLHQAVRAATQPSSSSLVQE